MKVKIKKLHEDAVIPSYAKEGDAGLDLTAIEWNDHYIVGEYSKGLDDDKHIYREYKTGLALEIPEGYVGLIRPRSSVSKFDLQFSTSGIVDSGYRGELTVRFKLLDRKGITYGVGDRIAQLVILPVPYIDLVEVNELSKTQRGEGGHGSTGL